MPVWLTGRAGGELEEDVFEVGGPARGQFGQRGLGDEMPAVDNDHGVHRVGDLGQDMAGYQDGAALGGQAAQQVTQPANPLRVEAVGRLVQDQQIGIGEQRGGQAEALAHTEREPADPAVGRVGEFDELEHVVDP